MTEIEITPGNIHDKYDIDDRRIGRGCLGTVVWKGVERKTGRKCAIKSVSKSMPNASRQMENLRREVPLLKSLVHPNILKIYDVYEDDDHLYLVTELCKGGELYDHVMAKKGEPKLGRGWEREAASIVRQILRAVAYCHALRVVHRDLKLENVLLKSKRNGKTGVVGEMEVCIIDFGLAARHDPSEMAPMTDLVGTPYYVAPEVLGRSYTEKCDIWSLGVLTYTLLCAKPPFDGGSVEEMYDAIRSEECRVEFPPKDWDGVSAAAREFVRSALEKDPASRPSAAELLEHEWVRGPPPPAGDVEAAGAEVGEGAALVADRRAEGSLKEDDPIELTCASPCTILMNALCVSLY